jgi:hypothetical protein
MSTSVTAVVAKVAKMMWRRKINGIKARSVTRTTFVIL